jgi:hypothetical protein
MMKPFLVPALDLWTSWQREAALNMTRAALMPMAAFVSIALSAEAARKGPVLPALLRPRADHDPVRSPHRLGLAIVVKEICEADAIGLGGQPEKAAVDVERGVPSDFQELEPSSSGSRPRRRAPGLP